MVEHYLKTTRWTENRSENYHFVLHHSHRIRTVNSFWGLVLPFWFKSPIVICCWWLGALVHMNKTSCWIFLISSFWPTWLLFYTDNSGCVSMLDFLPLFCCHWKLRILEDVWSIPRLQAAPVEGDSWAVSCNEDGVLLPYWDPWDWYILPTFSWNVWET